MSRTDSGAGGAGRRRWLLIGGAVAVNAAAVVVAVVLGGATDGSQATPGETTAGASPEPPPPLTEERAREIESGVTSGTDAELREVYLVADNQTLDPTAVAALATLKPLVIDVESFRDEEDGTASVGATTPATAGNPSGQWTLVLVADDDEWLLMEALPA